MMRKSLMIAAFVAPLAIAAAPRTASAQPISWNPAAAIAAGTGCRSVPPADTFFIAFGNQVSVLFTAFGARLPAFPDDASLSELKNCQVAIPATLQQGWYIGKLTQRLTYGVVKTAESTAKITSTANFFNVAVASFSVNIPNGAMNVPTTTQVQSTPIGVITGCAGTLQGLYKANMAIGATRANISNSIVVATQDLDIKFEIIADVFTCPFP